MSFAPRHLPGLSQPQIQIDISRIAKVVPRTGLSGIGVPEVLVNLSNVAASEQIRCSLGRTIGTTVDRLDGRDVGLEIPVRCPATIVGRGCRGQARIPAKDTRYLPATEYRFTRTAGITHK